MHIDNELRTLEIGDQTIRDYAQTLKSLADLLSNLDSPVIDRNLVMYMLNGLNEKFDNIINVIKHQNPFPSFDDAKSMLQDEELRLKRTNKAHASHSDHASSTSALVATASRSPLLSQNSTSTIVSNTKTLTGVEGATTTTTISRAQRIPHGLLLRIPSAVLVWSIPSVWQLAQSVNSTLELLPVR